jgi:hypothetical protein
MTVSGTNFGTHRAGLPDSIFDQLARFNVGLPNHNIIDVGTGTGTLARGFAWRGRIRASAGVAALDSDSARDFNASHAELLSTRFPATILAVPHRVFAIVAQSVSAGSLWPRKQTLG